MMLIDFPNPYVEIKCDRCKRYGRYAKSRLILQHGAGIELL